MSGKCGDCSCSDQSQCVKKGSAYGINIIETETSYVETMMMDAPAAAENSDCGKCKCGPSCPCTHCTCCSH